VLDDFSVSIIDELLARNNPVSVIPGANVLNRFDYNRDGTVSVIDQLLTRNNLTTVATKLQRITVPGLLIASGLSVAGPHDSFDDIAGALAIESFRETSGVSARAETEAASKLARPHRSTQQENMTSTEVSEYSRKRRFTAAADLLESELIELLATGRWFA
jgi:hypothetical protein